MGNLTGDIVREPMTNFRCAAWHSTVFTENEPTTPPFTRQLAEFMDSTIDILKTRAERTYGIFCSKSSPRSGTTINHYDPLTPKADPGFSNPHTVAHLLSYAAPEKPALTYPSFGFSWNEQLNSGGLPSKLNRRKGFTQQSLSLRSENQIDPILTNWEMEGNWWDLLNGNLRRFIYLKLAYCNPIPIRKLRAAKWTDPILTQYWGKGSMRTANKITSNSAFRVIYHNISMFTCLTFDRTCFLWIIVFRALA